MDTVENWKVGLGIVVREFRQGKRLSQESFAHEVGLTRNAIQKLERGNTNIRFESLIRVAGALGLAPADLLDKAGDLISAPAKFAKAKTQLEDERKKGRPSRVCAEPETAHLQGSESQSL